jgi:hypothetical protein
MPTSPTGYEEVLLMTAREAADWFEVNLRTAQRRAQRALQAGDPVVRKIDGAYFAPGGWWRKVLAGLIKPGL